MGTAPPERQSPSMPDPERLVSRSIALLKGLGMSDLLALETVAEVARIVRFRIYCNDQSGDWWLSRIVNIAEDRLAVPESSSTDRGVTDHADGTSS